ncbi:hypothetical protein QCA50_008541 [Cerrena zonata]|uniref:Fungal-type protein kinase domain-containing protein n=1 Tax=Cerrena zonata TaxID=2478898 RepID=A0AAW0GF44_9APHY
MAIDLLKTLESTPYLRHDVENVFYVALYLIIKSKDTFILWEDPVISRTLDSKTKQWGTSGSPRTINGTPQLLDDFSAYEPWILDLWTLSMEGQHSLLPCIAEFDRETLGDHSRTIS